MVPMGTWAEECDFIGREPAGSVRLTRHPDLPQQPAVRTLGSAALESWKTHYLHDHMPSPQRLPALCQSTGTCTSTSASSTSGSVHFVGGLERQVHAGHQPGTGSSGKLLACGGSTLSPSPRMVCRWLLRMVLNLKINRFLVWMSSKLKMELKKGKIYCKSKRMTMWRWRVKVKMRTERPRKRHMAACWPGRSLCEESMNVTVKNITFVETIEKSQLPACPAGHCQDLQPTATTWSSSDAVAF